MDAAKVVEILAGIAVGLAAAHYVNFQWEMRRVRKNLHRIRNLMTADRGRIWRIEHHLKLSHPPDPPANGD